MKSKASLSIIVISLLLIFSCTKNESDIEVKSKSTFGKKSGTYTAGEVHNLVMEDFLAIRQQIIDTTECDTSLPSSVCKDFFESKASEFLPNYIDPYISPNFATVSDFYNSAEWANYSSMDQSTLINNFSTTFSQPASDIVQDVLDLIEADTSYSTIYANISVFELDAENLPSSDNKEIVLAILDIAKNSVSHWETYNGGVGSWRPTKKDDLNFDGSDLVKADIEGAIGGALIGFNAGVGLLGLGGLVGALSGAMIGAPIKSAWEAFWSAF